MLRTKAMLLALLALFGMAAVALAAAEPAAESSAPAAPATPAANAAQQPADPSLEADGQAQAAQANNAQAEAKAAEPKAAEGATSQSPDPLGLKMADSLPASPDVPALLHLNGEGAVTAPNLAEGTHTTLSLDIDGRIKQTEALLSRMNWQLNREAAWANSVRDIIQNYQFKYSKVLSSIKKHTSSSNKLRKLLTDMKKARLHEVLEADLGKATRELTELAASSSETSADDNSYSALKDRVSLMKQDLAKLSHQKVNKVLHAVQDDLRTAAEESLPAPSQDTLKDIITN